MTRSLAFVLTIGLLGCGDSGEHQPEATHETPHWTYEAASEWGVLDPAFATCAEGTQQSPVDLITSDGADLPDVTFGYSPGSLGVEHNGHTVVAHQAEVGTFMVGEQAFDLKQFHVHTPSEHTVDGASYPMELHLVHADTTGRLAVVGILFTEGDSHPVIESLVGVLPTAEGESSLISEPINPAALLPASRSYYSYSGSLTTPPCSEGVAWHVMTEPVSASASQIAAIAAAIGTSNRPVQDLHGRGVRVGE